VKESAIDCVIHNKGAENLQCYTFISENSKNMSYVPDISKEQKDSEAEQNIKVVERKIFRVDLPNGEYEYVDEEKNVYDKSLYEKNKKLSKIGELVRNSNGKYSVKYNN
jgi:methionyl-tRNA formyltransferase